MVDRVHPLTTLAAAATDCAVVRLRALPPITRLILRGSTAPCGMALPDTCRATISGEHALLWLGPDEFLLLTPGAANDQLSTDAVDVSHRDTAISVSGERAAWAINAFCALDLDLSAFPIGMCTRTVFGKAEVVLWRTEPATFRIEVARSIAPYVWRCLEEARREFLD